MPFFPNQSTKLLKFKKKKKKAHRSRKEQKEVHTLKHFPHESPVFEFSLFSALIFHLRRGGHSFFPGRETHNVPILYFKF